MEQSGYFDDLIELQHRIDGMMNNDFDSDDFETYLSEHLEYHRNKSQALQLLSSLNIFISNHPKYSDYPKQLIISPLLHDTLSLFMSFELHQIFSIFSLRLLLYQHGFITINTIIESCARSPKEFAYFMHEIDEADHQFYLYFISKVENRQFLNEIEKEKEKHQELRIKGKNHNLIAEVIRNDDIQQFQEIIAQTNISLNSQVPFSFYEDCEFINNKREMPLLIEFASFFSSINIFKFLWINEIRGTQKSLEFAIAGGNYEIIHLFESFYTKQINQLFVKSAIIFHRNDIYSYLQETYEIKFSIDEFYACINSYNTEIFVCLFDQAFNLIQKSEFSFFFF